MAAIKRFKHATTFINLMYDEKRNNIELPSIEFNVIVFIARHSGKVVLSSKFILIKLSKSVFNHIQNLFTIAPCVTRSAELNLV